MVEIGMEKNGARKGINYIFFKQKTAYVIDL